MSKGPWHITVGPVGTDQWHAGVWVDKELVCTHTTDSAETAVAAVKDDWRRELGEHFTDQDFVVAVIDVGSS